MAFALLGRLFFPSKVGTFWGVWISLGKAGVKSPPGFEHQHHDNGPAQELRRRLAKEKLNMPKQEGEAKAPDIRCHVCGFCTCTESRADGSKSVLGGSRCWVLFRNNMQCQTYVQCQMWSSFYPFPWLLEIGCSFRPLT